MKLASVPEILSQLRELWRPPPKLNLSDWADNHFVLSAENSAEAGRWKTLPYQRGILNALSDPTVTQISFMKSARVGATKMMCVAVAYHIAQDPTTMLFVQPTIEGAAQFSKEEIGVMLRDVPALRNTVSDRPGEAETVAQKMFRGGSLQLVGANSGNGFRRVSRRIIFLDEVDSYPPSAGHDGDPVRLAIRRSEFYWNRKIFATSTPLVDGYSRIQTLFNEGDQRFYFVPCPECGHMDRMVFTQRLSGGHYLAWDQDKPETAYLVCSKNGCVIEHSSKREMIERGEWRASRKFDGHASFHISALYSYSPNSSWGDIAKEFTAVKGLPEQLRTFVNTVLGETWVESGEAPDWQRLHTRAEDYGIGVVPEGVKFITCGVDVQKDRCVYEVVGWGNGKESWSIDAGAIPMNTTLESDWTHLDELLGRQYKNATGVQFAILMLAVDSGYNTQMVYNWARRHPQSRVIATKGVGHQRTIISSPSPVDVKINGKRSSRGYKVWPVGVDMAKSELYGWLNLAEPGPGFCHFPQYAESFFKELTAEQLVSTTTKQGFKKLEWQLISGRENHQLDARILARAAASLRGLDRMPSAPPVVKQTQPTVKDVQIPDSTPMAPAPKPRPKPKKPSGWLGGNGWLNKRR